MIKNLDSNLPLHEAIKSGDLGTFKYLLAVTEKARIAKKKKDERFIFTVDLPGFNNMAPLQLAIPVENTDILNYLLASECSLNHRDLDGNTALHLALKQNKFDAVRRIFEAPNFSSKFLSVENN